MTIARIEDVAVLATAFGEDMGDVKPNVRKLNTDATRAPLPSDDETQGYEIGSRWLWQGQEWVAAGVGAGAAVWSSVKPTVGRDAHETIAAAAVANPGKTISISYDDQALPTDFQGVLLEYTNRASLRSYGLTGFETQHKAARMLRTMHGAHAGGNDLALMIETVANGSTANGPSNATIAQGITIAKKAYGSGSAVGGEIDGLRIVVRQDGPQGLANNDPGSSDCAGILVNAQNRGDCGWIAAFEAQTTNTNAVGGGIARQIQTKIGVLNTNDDLKRSYGFSAVSNEGVNHSAFYVAGFEYALFSDSGLEIKPNGEYAINAPAWPQGGGRISRDQGVHDAFTIQGRGNNGVLLSAPEGAIGFATSGAFRARFLSDGHFVPDTTNGINLGAEALRWNNVFSTALNISGGSATLSNLPVYTDNAAALAGGLTAGRAYRTATGQLMVTY